MTPGSVRSKDGTEIGFVRVGSGPALVIVHGSLGTGESWMPVANMLADQFTCYLMDRRGRAHSGDAPHYAIEREYEDVAAVLAVAGERPSLLGHSYGAICALGGALLSSINRLVLYEPPLPVDGPVGGATLVAYRDAVDAGELEKALEIGIIGFGGDLRSSFMRCGRLPAGHESFSSRPRGSARWKPSIN